MSLLPVPRRPATCQLSSIAYWPGSSRNERYSGSSEPSSRMIAPTLTATQSSHTFAFAQRAFRAADDYTAVDLTNCDREPIHVPGSIQPHGCLLACDTIRRGRCCAIPPTPPRCSASAARSTARPRRGASERRRRTTSATRSPATGGGRAGVAARLRCRAAGHFDVAVHRFKAPAIVEFEPAAPGDREPLDLARALIGRISARRASSGCSRRHRPAVAGAARLRPRDDLPVRGATAPARWSARQARPISRAFSASISRRATSRSRRARSTCATRSASSPTSTTRACPIVPVLDAAGRAARSVASRICAASRRSTANICATWASPPRCRSRSSSTGSSGG